MTSPELIADKLFRYNGRYPRTRKQDQVIERLVELDLMAQDQDWAVGDLHPYEELPQGVLLHVARCLCQVARDRNGLTEEETIAIAIWIAHTWTSVFQASQKAES